MKKLLKLSALLGIFAGFSLFSFNTTFAQGINDFGSSENLCARVTVKLIQNNDYDESDPDKGTKKIWQQCEEGSDDAGCRLRFCNEQSSFQSNDNPPRLQWNKHNCNKYCVTFQEAIPVGNKTVRSISGNSGTDLVMNYVSMIYKFGASILGIIAILVIVVSGVQMIAGGVDENNYTTAKDRILQALLSLAMLFSSALILRTINPDFFT